MEIYNAANAVFGPSAYGWDGTGDECGWEYVSCDEGGNIVYLDLAARGLTGTISTWIGVLTHLTSLSMDRNGNLDGQLPVELYSLTALRYLYMDQNDLTGPILPGIGYLSLLRELRLDQNALTGQIPDEIGEGCQTALDSGFRFL